MNNTTPRAWELYEQGRAYNDRLEPNQYALVNTNIAFFAGDQWIHMPDTPAMRRLPKPVFNIIKRVASLFVASLTSGGAAIDFSPMDRSTGSEDARMAADEVAGLLDKFKMDYRIREALFDGAQTGDYCAHFWWDAQAKPYGGPYGAYRGAVAMELVDGINVMFGNPADANVQRQPWVLLVGRDTVENLRQEARRHNPGFLDEDIVSDSETAPMAGQGGQVEHAGGKALYVILYTRQGDTVHVTKATRTATIYENVDTGLHRYPIAWGNWEKQKNQYHGRALVTGIIPNQIFINTMFAMVMRHLQLLGFPKTVYNADLIGQWSNEVGQAIGVRGLQPGQSVQEAAATLQPADMSAQILTVIDRAVSYTKDCLGATDAQLGNVNPNNTSALMVLQSASEVPLENTRAGIYEWLEDIGAILLDMMGTYYGTRPVISGDGSVTLYDFGKFKDLWFRIRVDVGPASRFSEIAMTQTLDNLRDAGVLDVVQYLERVPDRLIPGKDALIRELKEAIPAEKAKKTVSAQGKLSADKVLAGESARIQAIFHDLPESAQKAIVEKGQ